MKEVKIGKIKSLSLREVFGNEAEKFTPYVAEHLQEIIKETLYDVSVGSIKQEHVFKTLRVDIIASAGEDEDRTIIVENQFGESDSNHLGKLVTYASNAKADYAVWIVEKTKPEHKKAVDSLNDSAFCEFYIIEAKALKIDDSLPAIHWEVVCQPKESTLSEKKKKRNGKEISSTEIVLEKFWKGFLAIAKERNATGVENRTTSMGHSLNIHVGVADIKYQYKIKKNSFAIALDFSSNSPEYNKDNYSAIESDRQKIEELYKKPLYWVSEEDRKHCKVETQEFPGGYSDETKWEELSKRMTDEFEQFYKATYQFVRKIKKSKVETNNA